MQLYPRNPSSFFPGAFVLVFHTKTKLSFLSRAHSYTEET